MGFVGTMNEMSLICRKLSKSMCQSSSVNGEMMVKLDYVVARVEWFLYVELALHADW